MTPQKVIVCNNLLATTFNKSKNVFFLITTLTKKYIVRKQHQSKSHCV